MQFRHPEFLYFLFLLAIPVIVHLFQLRKFKKEYFTNVKFLQELDIKTRKSSQIKKWLLLFTRLLLLTFIILAFAQPYKKAENSTSKNNKLYIVLDNSHSMQALGKQGEILKRSIQDLMQNLDEHQTFTLLTNDNSFYDTDIKSIEKDLQNLNFSPNEFSLENQLQRIKSQHTGQHKDILVITDGFSLKDRDLEMLKEFPNLVFYLPKAENLYNASVDNVIVEEDSDEFYKLKVLISEYGTQKNPISVALYNQNEPIAKSIISDKDNEITFSIPKEDFNGYVQIEDNALEYDNTFYFSLSKPEKIKVMSIGQSASSDFLSKIYDDKEFEYSHYEIRSLDYNSIENQGVIILNELTEIPQSLMVTLKSFVENSGSVILIPSANNSVKNLNEFMAQFGNMQFQPLQEQKKLITKISFEHPVFRNVFERKTNNFQYPSIEKSFELKGNFPPILSFEDGTSFLTEISAKDNSVFVFAGPINKENSNFLNSPLVVLSFYNMAKKHNNSTIQSRFMGSDEPFFVDALLSKEEIITLKNENEEFIPLQQIFNRKIKLTFSDFPKTSGVFGVYKKSELITRIGFNYNRTESDLTQNNTGLLNDFKQQNISQFFDEYHTSRTDSDLWRILVVLALLFVAVEILIQKFVK